MSKVLEGRKGLSRVTPLEIGQEGSQVRTMDLDENNVKKQDGDNLQ